MISLHYTSHTKAYNTIYTACNIVEAIYSFTTIAQTVGLRPHSHVWKFGIMQSWGPSSDSASSFLHCDFILIPCLEIRYYAII